MSTRGKRMNHTEQKGQEVHAGNVNHVVPVVYHDDCWPGIVCELTARGKRHSQAFERLLHTAG